MGFWSTLFGANRSGTRTPGKQRASARSTGSDSSQPVDEEGAMRLSAVYGCVNRISGSISCLPVLGYSLSSSAPRKPAQDHPLSVLFAGKPNRYQTAVEFWATCAMQKAMHGNSYCLIGRINNDDPTSRIIWLLPLMADQMDVELLKDGTIVYKYTDGDTVKVFAESSIWHTKGMGNGIVGLSTLSYAANAVGLGLSADRRASFMAKRGFKPASVLMLDKLLKPEQREAIREQFADLVEGDGDPLHVLEAGMTWQQVSMSPADAQLLETRRFQLEDICRFFDVPPVLVGDMSASTVWGSGIEQLIDGFYRFSLRPHLEQFEASINARLLNVSERGRFEFEFDLKALLRMSPGAQATRIKEHVMSGLMTPNEGRIEQGLPRSDNPAADRLYMQAQLTPIEMLGTQVAKPAPALAG